MYNNNFTDPSSNLLTNRLQLVIQNIKNLVAYTREDYQAEIYSQLNKVISNGYNAAKFDYIDKGVPATVPVFNNAISTLDQDAGNVMDEVLDVENSMSRYFNLSAAAHNDLRQKIRTTINTSTQRTYKETFIDTTQLGSYDGTVDLKAGVYSPQATSTQLSPQIAVSNAYAGTGDITQLNSPSQTTFFQWVGSAIELVFNFPKATPVNRLTLSQYDYKDLSITNLVSSPDGSVVEDILEELGVSYIPCDVTSNKSLGDTTVDFNPKTCLSLRMTIRDNSGSGSIDLDSVYLFSQQFNATTTLVSNPITAPLGAVTFQADSISEEPYTTLSHYISYDGTSYQGIVPGQVVQIPSQTTQYWYKCVMSRNTTLINQSGSFTGNGLDPSTSNFYSLDTVTTSSLGNNIIEKSLLFNNIQGPVVIEDRIIPNTFYVQQGSTILPSSSYNLVNGTLNLAGNYNNVLVVYQTNADVTSVAGLLNYFGARLIQYSFEKS